jgi:hypothetical protein
VIGVNTPYLPRLYAQPTSVFRQAFGDNHYIVHFQEAGLADEALARDPGKVFMQLMRHGVPLAEVDARIAAAGRMMNLVEVVYDSEPLGNQLLTDMELQVYIDTFVHTGFTGGLNWYRNMDRNWRPRPSSTVRASWCRRSW